MRNYHPGVMKAEQLSDFEITAPGAEAASVVIRERIAAETKGRDILAEFDRAVEREDIQALYSILNSAWFGVPESTSCWQIPGFKVAVSLLDDPPEPEVD